MLNLSLETFGAASASRGNLNLGSDWTVSRITALRLFESTLFVLRVISQHLTAKLISLSPRSSVVSVSEMNLADVRFSLYLQVLVSVQDATLVSYQRKKTHISCFSRLYQTVNLRPSRRGKSGSPLFTLHGCRPVNGTRGQFRHGLTFHVPVTPPPLPFYNKKKNTR